MRIFQFFDLLVHSRGKFTGDKFHLLEWQRSWLTQLFGTVNKNGLRQYRSSFLTVGKGNGKSSFSAAIALYMLLADGEQNPQVAIAAGDRGQASIIFDECQRLVKASPRLRDVIHAIPSQKTLTYPKRDGKLMALSSESSTKHGLDLSCLVFDEFHVHKNRELYDTLVWATSKDRKQPLTLYLTTAGYDKASICHDVYLMAKQIRDKVIKDKTFLPVIYEADPTDPIDEQSTWEKANPSLGVLIDKEQFKRDLETAKTSQGSLSAFKRYRLNIWTSSESGYIDLDKWDYCHGAFPQFPKNTDIFLAADLSATTDLTSLVGVVAMGQRYYVYNWSWVSEEGVKKREKTNLQRYQQFVGNGLTVVPGNAVEHSLVREQVHEIAKTFHVRSINFDKWNALYLAETLGQDGFEVYPFPQTASYYTLPMKRLEALVLDGKVTHQGSALLKWQLGNVAVETDSQGNIKPSKKKSADKIDSVCALIMAIGAACQSESQAPIKPSVYEDRGLLIF